MIFRRLNSDDKKEIQKFFDDMSEESASFFNVNHGNEKRTMEFFENGKPNHIFWVAEEGNTIVGLAFIWGFDTSIPWFGIAVRDDFQGKHVGTFIIENIFDFLKSNGYGGLFLRTAQTNFKAQRLYERRGFERVGVHPSGEFLYIKRFER